ncbi:UDP-2,3-diacylglucosamine diphosphatase [Maribacter sp. SA7]|uniref:UDP-2,3-diacylglucosamine diphosphatase n=1 Tax=Maribacter zhoushanensis TaxID=3030012 RepID=UPI0023EC45BF|nr:UDP-2,3-diacylglucosamine diphosphatase [Maribacter zhoushanensis]MDF4202855.1 UDP-2,3-diacylglucosamine diphosphatase [Maribacter zhoushanensis]
MKKRRLEIAVLSDVHLGSYACHAEELLTYLSSIDPKILILNGDILDAKKMRNNYFPPSHLKVVKKIFSLAAKGTVVHYITGNRDEPFRKIDDLYMGAIQVSNRLTLKLNGKNTLFFHGDIFDFSFRHSQWLLNFGGAGFDILLKLAKLKTKALKLFGKKNKPFSNPDLEHGNRDPEQIALFEKNVAKMAIKQHYDHVVCGHSHAPNKQLFETKKGECLYLNSGDWVKHMTALEYSFKRWKLYRYENDKLASFYMDEELKSMDMNELIATITDRKERKLKNKKEKGGLTD